MCMCMYTCIYYYSACVYMYTSTCRCSCLLVMVVFVPHGMCTQTLPLYKYAIYSLSISPTLCMEYVCGFLSKQGKTRRLLTECAL